MARRSKSRKQGSYDTAHPGRLSTQDAKRAGPALDTLALAHAGTLTPKVVVEAARARSSALHGFFEWNDARAAVAHREDQARLLLRSVVWVPVVDGEPQTPIRRFLNVTGDDDAGRQYVTIDAIRENPRFHAQIVAEALASAQAWMQRYQQYAELAPIVSAIVTTVANHTPPEEDPS